MRYKFIHTYTACCEACCNKVYLSSVAPCLFDNVCKQVRVNGVNVDVLLHDVLCILLLLCAGCSTWTNIYPTRIQFSPCTSSCMACTICCRWMLCGTQFPCFNGTKVQILTQKALQAGFPASSHHLATHPLLQFVQMPPGYARGSVPHCRRADRVYDL